MATANSTTQAKNGSQAKNNAQSKAHDAVDKAAETAHKGVDGAAAAAENGGVTRISTVDTTQLNVLTIYSQQCTIVKGDNKNVSRGNTNRPGPGFSDTVIMRDGTVHRNVKTIIQGNLINIIKPDGTSLTVPKTQVRTVRKGR